MNQSKPWRWQSHAPVRADAESLFVPCGDLPDADIGDGVVVHGPDDGDQRAGTIIATSEADGQQFFSVELDR